MTRFARAKGSKASNEKLPEDGTPWEVMKEQLLQAKKDNEEAKKREQAEKQRIENYEKFLKEQKIQKRKASWCEFPDSVQKRKLNKINANVDSKKIKSKSENNSASLVSHIDSEKSIKQNKNLKKNKNNALELTESTEVELNNENGTKLSDQANSEKDHNDEKVKSNKRKSKLKKKSTILEINPENHSKLPEKSKQKKKENKLNDLNFANNTNVKISSEKHKVKKIKNHNDEINIKILKNDSNENPIQKKKQNKKKLINGKPVRRKEINDKSFQLIINGKEIELVRFDGFPIMKKDSERLKELKASMFKKGIPSNEVQRTIKLERRRAEKALARLKRDVCYNCRKGGHNLSDCPELKSKIPGVDAAAGICFKCGSTEHRQFECKVQKDKEFRFASCFICKEQGHIARQCPDNPKGLYPNGGSCKLCGDVTHLRKDCPTVNQQKQETSYKLQTIDNNSNLEDIDQQVKSTVTEQRKNVKKIKF